MCWALCLKQHFLWPHLNTHPLPFPEVTPFEKLSLTSPTHQSGQLRALLLVLTTYVCSYNVPLTRISPPAPRPSLLWHLLYWLIFPPDYEKLEGKEKIFYFCNLGPSWVLGQLKDIKNCRMNVVFTSHEISSLQHSDCLHSFLKSFVFLFVTQFSFTLYMNTIPCYCNCAFSCLPSPVDHKLHAGRVFASCL